MICLEKTVEEKGLKIPAKVMTPSQVLVLGFALVILFGALLLSLPQSTQDGVGLPFLNAAFTATSAVCVTGLVVVDTDHLYAFWGMGHSFVDSSGWTRFHDLCHDVCHDCRKKNYP